MSKLQKMRKLDDPELIEILRKACTPGRKSMAMDDLEDEHLVRIYDMVRRGIPIRDTVRCIQDQWKLLTGYTFRTVEKNVSKWSRIVFGEKFKAFQHAKENKAMKQPEVRRVLERVTKFEREAHNRIKQHFDPLYNLIWLFQTQEKRINQFLMIEAVSERPIKEISTMLSDGAGILKDFVKMAGELGLLDIKSSGNISINLQKTHLWLQSNLQDKNSVQTLITDFSNNLESLVETDAIDADVIEIIPETPENTV
jgi:hypothetical protein